MRPTASQLDLTSCRLTSGVDSHTFSVSPPAASAQHVARQLKQLHHALSAQATGPQKVHGPLHTEAECTGKRVIRGVLRHLPAITLVTAPPERLLCELRRRTKLLAPGVL